MPISPLQEPQYGDKIQLEQAQKAVPLQAAQEAAPPTQPAAPQPPAGGSAAGQVSEEEFLPPLSAANISYDEAVMLFNLQVLANMAVDERSHPDMAELYWALKQDLDELRGEKEPKTAQKEEEPQSEQKSATGASDEASEGNKARGNQDKKEEKK